MSIKNKRKRIVNMEDNVWWTQHFVSITTLFYWSPHKIAWLVVTESGNRLLLCVKWHRLDKLQNGAWELFKVLFLESKTGLCMKKDEKENPCWCAWYFFTIWYLAWLGSIKFCTPICRIWVSKLICYYETNSPTVFLGCEELPRLNNSCLIVAAPRIWWVTH